MGDDHINKKILSLQCVSTIFFLIGSMYLILHVVSWLSTSDNWELQPVAAIKHENRHVSQVRTRRTENPPPVLIDNSSSMLTEPLNFTLGVVADEIFDPKLGITGGYEVPANMLGQFFRSRPDLVVHIVFISANPQRNSSDRVLLKGHDELLGWPLASMISRANDALQGFGIDMLLLVGYSNAWQSVLQAMPQTPVIFWVQDRPLEEQIGNIGGDLTPAEWLPQTEANEGRKYVLETQNPGRFWERLEGIARRVDLRTWPTNRGMLKESFPVSIVIPSFSRVSTLPGLIAHLLSLSSMQHPQSEVLVPHASQESWYQHVDIQMKIKEIIKSGIAKNKLVDLRVIHMNYVKLNSEMGCTIRYFAAKKARNDVIVHLDDDIKPNDYTIQKMILLVRMEKGFPNYEDEANIPQFYGSSRRLCGCGGYHTAIKRVKNSENTGDHQVILTNFVSMSAVLNREFVSAFVKNDVYKLAMRKYAGNGCDLIFDHFSISRIQNEDLQINITPAEQQNLGGVFISPRGYSVIENSKLQGFYGGETHFYVRRELCRCLYSDLSVDCVNGIEDLV